MEDNPSESREERESNYFPGCRKDANCNCKMCLDSISATLDLMSMSAQRSSLTKLSASKPKAEKSLVSIDPTLLSTPVSRNPPPVAEVASSKHTTLRSTAKTVHIKEKKRDFGIRLRYCWWVLLVGLILAIGLEIGVSWGVTRVLRPRLSGEILRDFVEGSSGAVDLSRRLVLIQESLNGFVDGKSSSCILGDSTWRINQDGLILISYCTLYQSAAEEVLIWGWPLQTSGLLTAGFSSRSFNVLSGNITEWPEGKVMYVVREANTTWILRKWSASVVQFEPRTWIIEYKRNSLLENPSILVAAVEFFKFRILKLMLRMKQQLWLLLADFRYYTASTSEAVGLSIPT